MIIFKDFIRCRRFHTCMQKELLVRSARSPLTPSFRLAHNNFISTHIAIHLHITIQTYKISFIHIYLIHLRRVLFDTITNRIQMYRASQNKKLFVCQVKISMYISYIEREISPVLESIEHKHSLKNLCVYILYIG